jgi:hypothetical protein
MDYPESKGWYTRCLYNRKVDGVIAISAKLAELLLEAGVERERIRLIRSGTDPRPFDRAVRTRELYPERMVVGVAAVLEERKGHRFCWKRRGGSKRAVTGSTTVLQARDRSKKLSNRPRYNWAWKMG